MSTDGQTDPFAAAYQGAVDRLLPELARKRKFEEWQQAIAADLNDDPKFWVMNLSDLSRDSVLTVTHIAAITLEINHVHRCANIDWARKYGQYATGTAAATLKNLVTRTDRIAVHFKLQPSDSLAVDEGFDFAATRQWHVPHALQAKNTHQDERVMPAEATSAPDSVETDQAGPVPLKSDSAPERNTPSPVATGDVPAKPWLLADPKDPAPEYSWYTPARYFARQLVAADSTLLTKRLVLADKVSKSLAGAEILKRGEKKPPAPGTVLKAFANVRLG